MHIFLQGQRGIGKSTVIRKVLEIITTEKPVLFGGFFTWKDGNEDPNIYIKPAADYYSENDRKRLTTSRDAVNGEKRLIASRDPVNGGMKCDVRAFEETGVRLLDCKNAGLILMDELGFLERDAKCFKQAVYDRLEGDVPILGVLRLAEIPWFEPIINNPKVKLISVDETNRDSLPRELADMLLPALCRP